MATYEGGLDLDIAATFGDVAEQHVAARLFPLAGPTYDELVVQHQRWMAGESVTPTALHIGEIVLLSEEMQVALTAASSYGRYRKLHDGDKLRIGHVPDEVAYGESYVTEMMHELVYMVSAVDAVGRGLNEFYTSNHVTNGGRLARFDGTMRRHINKPRRKEVALCYSASVGDPTRFTIDPLSMNDVDEYGYIIEGRAGERILRYPAGVIAVTLFTEQTPYRYPEAYGLPRLNTSLYISRSEIID